MAFESIDPASGEFVESFPEMDAQALARALARAEAAALAWAAAPFAERAGVLRRAAEILRTERRDWAEQMAREMGKPVRQGEAEAEKCAAACEHFAEHAERMLAPIPAPTDSARSHVRFDPLGAVLAIMPWNFPFWQVFRFAAPALMAGNVALLKHAPNVPRCALAIEAILVRAGLPAGVFQCLFVSPQIADELIAHPTVRAVTLTGSERAGAEVGAAAGRALKKAVLELGGSDPFLVLDDAPLAAAAREAARARTQNSGQSCIAAKRFLVHERVFDAFVEAFARELDALRVGDPLQQDTEVGPLAREDLLHTLDDQVRESVALGARIITGGRPLARKGFFYPPTLLVDVEPGMPVADDETFGPVAAVFRVRSDEDAVRAANASRYGLGASVWSADPARAEKLVPRLEAGCVFVNGVVRSDPRLPFGGIKRSGYGRELSEFGIREFVNVKSVWLGPTPR